VQLKLRAANLAEVVPTKEIGSQSLSGYSRLLSTLARSSVSVRAGGCDAHQRQYRQHPRTTLLALDDRGNGQRGGIEVQGFGCTYVVYVRAELQLEPFFKLEVLEEIRIECPIAVCPNLR
jgi:hypothetical protein